MKILSCIIVAGFLLTTLFTLSSLSNIQQSQSKADSIRADKDKHLKNIRAAIAGKEKLPADSVFKDIQIFKGVPAGRLLAIMDIGYSQSLGVSCGHCHSTTDFASSEKPQKQIARDMHAMSAVIREQLSKIKNIKSAVPLVNCTTCHRGQVKPATNLEGK